MEALHLAGPGRAQQEQYQLAASLEKGWWQSITATKPHAVAINNGDQDSAQVPRHALCDFKKEQQKTLKFSYVIRRKGSSPENNFMVQSKVYNQTSRLAQDSSSHPLRIYPPRDVHPFYIATWYIGLNFCYSCMTAPGHRQRIRKVDFFTRCSSHRLVSEVKGTEERPKAAVPLDRLWYGATEWGMTLAIELAYNMLSF